MISFNILDHLTLQNNTEARVTRNRAQGTTLSFPLHHLESTAHFYPIRLARLWNSLPLDLRNNLLSPLPISSIKTLLNNHYMDQLANNYNPDNTCTLQTACRCHLCHVV